MEVIRELREMMKSNFTQREGRLSDQDKGFPQLPLEKPFEGGKVVDLPKVKEEDFAMTNVIAAIMNRKSRRKYKEESLTLKELAFLLMSTQGVRSISKDNKFSKRMVPSGGARHAFVTYLLVQDVEMLDPGVYRYHPLTHQLEFLFYDEKSKELVARGTLDQTFTSNSPVTFIWSAIPYRSEWRYDTSAHKTMLLDAGHICQNLYIACEAIKCGTCAVAAYDQELMDMFLKLDGENEFVVYLAPVGKAI